VCCGPPFARSQSHLVPLSAALLNRIVSPVATGVLFFVVFTPFALILRMAGKDLLRLRRDPRAASYWIERKPPGPPPESMVEQF